MTLKKGQIYRTSSENTYDFLVICVGICEFSRRDASAKESLVRIILDFKPGWVEEYEMNQIQEWGNTCMFEKNSTPFSGGVFNHKIARFYR